MQMQINIAVRRCLTAMVSTVIVGACSIVAASADAKAPPPWLYNGTNNTVSRPHTVVVDSADGGELVLKWTRWTARSARAHGTAHPDHGSYPITVTVSRVVDGVFTRMTINIRVDGHTHANRMALAVTGSQVLWMRTSWMDNPESGATPWNGPIDD
jgi:hypothetical protein